MSTGKAAGRIRWKLFGIVTTVGLAGTLLMVGSLSTGAIAASFAVSGTNFKASSSKLIADDVVQFGSVDQGTSHGYPVLVNGFKKATMDNFCVSMVVPDLPGVGDITVRLGAKGNKSMSADNLVLSMENAVGDLTLNNVQIGRDASTFDRGPAGLQGPPGSFGIQSSGLVLGNLHASARSATASTLHVDQVAINVQRGHNECY